MFTRGEMEAIAAVVQRSGNPNVVVVSDEVYKFTVYESGHEVSTFNNIYIYVWCVLIFMRGVVWG